MSNFPSLQALALITVLENSPLITEAFKKTTSIEKSIGDLNAIIAASTILNMKNYNLADLSDRRKSYQIVKYYMDKWQKPES